MQQLSEKLMSLLANPEKESKTPTSVMDSRTDKEYTNEELDEIYKDDPQWQKAQKILAKQAVSKIFTGQKDDEIEKARAQVREYLGKAV